MNGYIWREIVGKRQDRLIAFFDAVLAIAITVLALEMVIPAVDNIGIAELKDFLASVTCYLISFVAMAMLWYIHTKFFSMYNLTGKSEEIVLHLILLFVVTLFQPATRAVGLYRDDLGLRVMYIGIFTAMNLLNIVIMLVVRHNNDKADKTRDELKDIFKANKSGEYDEANRKMGVRPSTRAGYKTVVNILEKEEFGSRRIDRIKLSDAKTWLIKLQRIDGRSYSSIHNIRGVLRPAFQMAVDDDLIRKNPFEFQLVTVIVNDSVTREAITRDQKRKFLEFIKNDRHFCRYYDAIYILFYTGMRISEFTGLTLNDIDLKNQRINIDHQLQRTSQMEYVILPPKTESGARIIPMTDGVYDCFERIVNNRKRINNEPVISGYTDFLFYDKNDMPMTALHWEKYFEHICEKYNKIYREPMPKITPHVCRHTYCSHMASSGMNPKHLQYLMGHSDIGVKLNTYTHVDLENVIHEVNKLSKTA